MSSGDDVTREDVGAQERVAPKASPSRSRKRAAGQPGEGFGNALRSVYHDAVLEGVPDDLLDLLKKLD